MKRTIGCLTRGFIFVVLVGIIAAVAVSFIGGDSDSEKHTLLGDVLVMKDEGIEVSGDTCTASFWGQPLAGGDAIHIEDGSTDGVDAALADGVVTPEGNCSFEFVADVGDTDLYAFTINGRTVLRTDEQIGKDIPEGLGHTRTADGDWWVTVGPGQFED